jgi:RNA polymerase sigma-70 factor (ECF subfamily)
LPSATQAFDPAGGVRDHLERTWAGYVRRIAAADPAALEALYDATSRLIYGMALRILDHPADAEEAVLDVYHQVWREAAAFDAQRSSVTAWLVTLARDRAIERLHSRADRGRRAGPPAQTAGGAVPQGDELLGVERAVQAALGSLPPEQREAIELAFWYGYRHAELAARLGQPVAAVKSRIRTGMMKLRSELATLS